ncbi:GTPase-activating protein [Rhodotorula kratochvilovae]
MPLWSRSAAAPAPDAARPSPSSSSLSLSSSPPPPGFLANHHRRSSSTLSAAHTRTASSSAGADPAAAKRTASAAAGKRPARASPAVLEASELGDDDEPWDENSDDERAVEALAGRMGGVSLVIPPTQPRGPSRSASGSSAATAEAVAAALSGRPAPAPAPSAPQRGASYLAGASRVQEEADKVVRAEERRLSVERGETVQEPEELQAEEPPAPTPEEEDETEEEEKKGEGWAREQCRKAIRRDVDELVKDPAHVLDRLKTAWAAPAPPPPSHAHRASISSISAPSPNPNASPDDDEDDDDPTRGYVQLDAPALSCTDPSIVEFDAPPPNPEEEGERGRENRRKRKFLDVLGSDNVDLAELRKLAWSGVPDELRTMVWQLLLGYLPAPLSRRASTLARKRSEYASLVRQAFSRGVKGLDGPIWHQISIDVPRTRPGVRLWMAEATQRSLERVLYVWAIRHPASGYVQGINDLVTPFFQVFLQGYIDADPETFDVSVLPPPVLEALEADSFWCLSKLLDGIQDNYIFAQPGIQRLVKKMDGLCARVDAPLAAHLKEQGVEFIQFAFRWMNCLLMRELSVKNIVRMWDTYLAEGGDAFSEFHLYVCLAFLVRWSDTLREMDFQSIIIFLQSLPTQDWTDKDTELLLSEAFLWSRTFQAR